MLKEMMDFVRSGDIVVVESISRFARNTRDLLELVDQLVAKGVQFVSMKEKIDTSTPSGKFMLTVLGLLLSQNVITFFKDKKRELPC